MFAGLRELQSNEAIRKYQLGAKYLLTPTSFIYYICIYAVPLLKFFVMEDKENKMKETLKSLFKKYCNKETILYVIFGVLTTLVDWVCYLLIHNRMSVELATAIAWLLAVIFAFITNKLFVFESKAFQLKILIAEGISFFSARVASLVFTIVYMHVTVKWLGWNDLIAKLTSAVFVVIANYFLSKFFIFKKGKEAA